MPQIKKITVNIEEPKTIKVLWPSSVSTKFDGLTQRINRLEKAGFKVIIQDPIPEMIWPFATSSIAERAKELNDTLLDPHIDVVLCGRGGYGLSDVLPLMDWKNLKKARPKPVVGFSDITALQSALLSQLQWPSIHGPMIQSDLWPAVRTKNESLILKIMQGATLSTQHAVKEVLPPRNKRIETIKGRLWGGCFSVLTNLIGTPYFPKLSTERHILFWEDVSETAPKLVRYFNQWLQSGCFDHVDALILGRFTDMSINAPQKQRSVESLFRKELAKRLHLPIFSCESFGHIKNNIPLFIGGEAIINGMRLHSRFPETNDIRKKSQ